MDNENPVRIHQGEQFIVTGLSGKPLEQLIGLECTDKPGHPVIIYLKAGDSTWQQYFLDAGIACWENTGTTDMTREEGFTYVDYLHQYNIQKGNISSIYCEKKQHSIQVVLVTDNNQQLILRYKNAAQTDADCEFLNSSTGNTPNTNDTGNTTGK